MNFEQAISSFPADIQSELTDTLNTQGMIPETIVSVWLERLGIEIGTLMIRLLPVAASYARVPISNFHVGAVALGMPQNGVTGSLYLGANMEFTGEALSLGVHGEQSATNNAWLSGESGLQALAINAAPCGYCRQFLYELSSAKKLNILLKKSDDPNDYSYTSNLLTHFLPDAFGPQDLGLEGGLMKPESHNLNIATTDSVALKALTAANACYAPYTEGYAGVALKDSSGNIFTGRYGENAAYNPSLSPLESALAYMNMHQPAKSSLDIVAAVLVEATSKTSQQSVTQDVLSSVAPGVSLQYIQAS